jgi:hypothetical protein
VFGLRYVGRVDGVSSFVATTRGRRFWCPDNAVAVVWGACVIYRSTDDLNNPCTRRHEKQHILQKRTMGRFRFWRVYQYYQRHFGYENNPLEIDARRAANRTRQVMLDRLRKKGLLRQ